MPNPTYAPSELAPEVIKVGDKLHTALDEIAEDNGIFSDISTALQQKTGQVEPYAKEDIANTISDDLVFPSGTLNISSNGDYDVSAKETAHVAVPGPNLITKQITVNGTYSAEDETPPADGYRDVVVDVYDTQFSALINRTITSISDSKITIVGAYAFRGCTSLTNVNVPNATSIDSCAFYGCTSLTNVNAPNITSLTNNSFGDCTRLLTLVLRKRAILHAANAIPSQTIVYVENADLDWYSTATNWSSIYADGRIKSIDELPE